jgi:hypothetical protein
MAAPGRTGKQEYWLEQVERWLGSGLGVREFCERRRLSEQSFYAWRRTLVERGLIVWPKPATAAFVPVRVEASTARPTSAIEVVLADGRTLRVSAGFDGETLRRVVEALEGRPC